MRVAPSDCRRGGFGSGAGGGKRGRGGVSGGRAVGMDRHGTTVVTRLLTLWGSACVSCCQQRGAWGHHHTHPSHLLPACCVYLSFVDATSVMSLVGSRPFFGDALMDFTAWITFGAGPKTVLTCSAAACRHPNATVSSRVCQRVSLRQTPRASRHCRSHTDYHTAA